LPVTNKEISESTASLKKRIPKAKDEGGFIHYLGLREHEADKIGVEYERASPKKIKELMHEHSITKTIQQFREIVSAKGYKYKLY
jgi:hypothetical protein